MNLSPLHKRALTFLRVQTWSTLKVLQLQLQLNSPQSTSQLMKRMAKIGLINSAEIKLAAGHKVKIFGITEYGLAYAFDLNEEVTTTRSFEPSKVSPATLQHELDIQLLHINAEKYGWNDWQNGSSLGKRLRKMKIPDAIVHSPLSRIYCVEAERELKSTRRYREIIASHLSARKQGHWEHILYLCPDLDLAKRLQRKIASLQYLLWNGSRIALTNAHLEPFTFADYEFFNSKTRVHTL
jgi:hypothetical protein